MLPDAVRGHGGHGERLTAEDAVAKWQVDAWLAGLASSRGS